MAERASQKQKKEDEFLPVSQILMHEFDYYRKTALSAVKERGLILRLFLLSAVLSFSLIAALTSRSNLPSFLLSFFFIFVFITGILIIYQFAHLLNVMHKASLGMNRIKDYIHEMNPDLYLKDRAFIWTTDQQGQVGQDATAPLFMSSAAAAAAVSSLSFGAAVYEATERIVAAAVCALFFFVLEMMFYQNECRRK